MFLLTNMNSYFLTEKREIFLITARSQMKIQNTQKSKR